MLIKDKLKIEAIKLRSGGMSYREISSKLGIARSTLSGWLKNVPLTAVQKQVLHDRWIAGLYHARELASQAHRHTKEKRIENSRNEAEAFVRGIPFGTEILEIFLAGLYLGDGFKGRGKFGLGNSNPGIVLLFLALLRVLYHINESKLRIAVFARADQNTKVLVEYWSALLNVPKSQFYKTQVDQRTRANPSFENYHGVCAVNYFDTNIQQRILEIGNQMVKYASSGRLAQLV